MHFMLLSCLCLQICLTAFCFNQVIKEFARLQPDAKDFVDAWEQMAPIVIAYAYKKTDNLDVSSLLDEMNRGGQGRSAEAGYKPPSCEQRRIFHYLHLRCF